MYKIFIEELQNGRISYKDSPEIILLLLEFASDSPSLFEEYKVRTIVSFLGIFNCFI